MEVSTPEASLDYAEEEHYFDYKPEMVTLRDGTVVLKTNDGFYVVEGNILLTKQQIDILESPLSRGGIIFLGAFWTNAEVYYTFDASITDEMSDGIQEAIGHWQENTCLTFTERTTELNYIEFYQGSGNSSPLGMIGGKQRISLNGADAGTAIHEIGHSMGLIHEHSRTDRDSYVRILYDNIRDDAKTSFHINWNSDKISQFDFNSVMMYGSKSFSKNNEATMERIDGISDTWLVNRTHLSDSDMEAIESIYGKKHEILGPSRGSAGETLTFSLDATSTWVSPVSWSATSLNSGTITEVLKTDSEYKIICHEPGQVSVSATIRPSLKITRLIIHECVIEEPDLELNAPILHASRTKITTEPIIVDAWAVNAAWVPKPSEYNWTLPTGVEIIHELENSILIQFASTDYGRADILCKYRVGEKWSPIGKITLMGVDE